MPKIIQPTRQRAGGQPRNISIAPSQEGRATAALGREVTRAASLLNEAVERNAAIQSDKDMADFRLEAQEELKNRQLNAGPGAEDFTEEFENYLTENKAKLMERSGTSRSRDRLDAQFSNLQLSMQGQAMTFETGERARHAVNSAETVFDSNASAMRQNPDFDQLGDILEQNAQTATVLPIEQSKQEKLTIQANQSAHFEMFNGFLDTARLTKDSDMATQLLDDLRETGKWDTAMSEQQFVQTLNRAMSLSQQINNDNKTANVAALKDWISQGSSGRRLDLHQEMKDLANQTFDDKETRDAWNKKLDNANLRGNVRNKVQHISLEDKSKLAQNVENNLDEKGNFIESAETLRAFNEEIKIHEKNLKERRAEYSMEGNELLPELYAKWLKDPSAVNTTAYVNAQVSEQTRMGVRPGNVKLFTNNDISGLKFKFEEIEKTAAGADVYFQEIKNLRKQGDAAWGLIQKQLVEEKVLTPVSGLVSSMDSAADDAMMLKVLRAERSVDELEKILPDGKKTFNRLADSARLKTETMFATLRHNSSGIEASNTINRAIQLGAAQLMAEGMNEDDAIDRASLPFMNKHTFVDTYRIPVQHDARFVERGANMVKSQLDKHVGDIGVTSYFIDGQEMAATEAIRRLQEDGEWVTNGDESGLTLTWTNGSGVWFTDTDGQTKLVTKTFDELLDIGRTVQRRPE